MQQNLKVIFKQDPMLRLQIQNNLTKLLQFKTDKKI